MGNLRRQSTSKSPLSRASRAVVIAPGSKPLRWPSRAIGSSRVTPIASGRLKQKNSLKPTPAKAAKKGPMARIQRGWLARAGSMAPGPLRIANARPPRQPSSQNSCRARCKGTK